MLDLDGVSVTDDSRTSSIQSDLGQIKVEQDKRRLKQLQQATRLVTGWANTVLKTVCVIYAKGAGVVKLLSMYTC